MMRLAARPWFSRATAPFIQLTTPILSTIEFQQRFRWTKAKKKRQIRTERRKALERKGKSLPKPSYYFPRDTPVFNAPDQKAVEEEIRIKDEKMQKELHERMQKRQVPLRFHMTQDLRMSDRVRKLFDLHNACQREVVAAQKQQGMQLFQLRPGDTGSSAVQVVALTTRIQQMQAHLTKHKKDKHSKRGMDAMYVRRRKLLDYMEREDFDSYRHVVKTLGLVR